MTAPPVRWARDSQGRLHAVEPSDALRSAERGFTEVLCGQLQLPPDVTFEPVPSGGLCFPCVIGATADVSGPDPEQDDVTSSV